MGASGQVASDLQYKLVRIGRIAFAWNDIHGALSAASLLGEGSVAIGISHSGSTIDSVQPLARARAGGARTIGLTNFTASPLARESDILLTTAARETTFRSGATASRIAQLAVVDILFVAVAQTDVRAATDALSKTYDAVTGQRITGGNRGQE